MHEEFSVVILYGEVQLSKESFEALWSFSLAVVFFLLAVWREWENFPDILIGIFKYVCDKIMILLDGRFFFRIYKSN